METFETVNTFRKLQLDSSPLHRHHLGSSSLSLSLSGSGQKSGLASTPRQLSTASIASPATQTPTPATPITFRISRTLDSFAQPSSDTPELSSSGRYAQSNFTLSPLERAARNDSPSLFNQYPPNTLKHDARRTAPSPLQTQQSASKGALAIAQKEQGKPLFEKKVLTLSNTDSKFNYDFTREHCLPCPEDVAVEDEPRSPPDDANKNESGDGPNYRAIEPTLLMHSRRRRLLSPSLFERMLEEDQDRMSSLTSDSTVGSPLSEALATPTDSECSDMYGPGMALATRCRSFHDPISLGETSAWPRNIRNKSYNFEVVHPPDASSRRKRRAFSEKRLSPANQFLSGWSCQKAPEPDDEGQEVGAYVIGKQVGFGGFSVVKEAVTIKNGMKVKRAVKIVRKKAHDKESENDRIQTELEHEVSIWRYLSHPHILPLIEVYDSPFATFCFTRLTTNGTLFDLLKANRQGLPVLVAQKYSYQLASAIRYLHEDVRIIHRDIKPENCLIDVSVDAEGSLLLCDFGMAEQIPCDDDSDSDSSYVQRQKRQSEASACVNGSLPYASPEMMISSTPFLSTAVDIWAYGVTVFVLHTGILPFNHTFQPKLQMMIAKGDWDVNLFRNAEPFKGNEDFGRMALTVLKGCLCKNPEMRWNVGTVLESEWLEDMAVECP